MVQLSLYYFDGSSICSGKSKSCRSISISGVSSMIGGKDPWFLDTYVRDRSDHRCLFPTSWSVTRWVTPHGRTIRQIVGFRIYQSLINIYFALGTSDCSQICPSVMWHFLRCAVRRTLGPDRGLRVCRVWLAKRWFQTVLHEAMLRVKRLGRVLVMAQIFRCFYASSVPRWSNSLTFSESGKPWN